MAGDPAGTPDEAEGSLSSVKRKLMVWDPGNRAKWLRYSAAVLVIFAAAAIRLHFLEVLGFRVAFITLYPAVAVAALFGGFGPGFLSTVLSVALANYFWMEPVGGFGITNIADLTSIIVFLFSCTLIGFLAEATYAPRPAPIELKNNRDLAQSGKRGLSIFSGARAGTASSFRTPTVPSYVGRATAASLFSMNMLRSCSATVGTR